jgi:muramoyltetrapeptide carboxypeptidase
VKYSLKPPKLKEGSTIMVVAPSAPPGYPGSGASLSVGLSYLKKRGFRVTLGDTIKYALNRWFHSATDEARARDLMNAFLRDDVDAVWCVRGMSGAVRVIRLLDYDVIKEHPKVIIGFSDITAIQTAVYAKTGLPSLQAPMLDLNVTPNDEVSLSRFRRDMDMALTILSGETPELKPLQDGPFPRVITPGKASGTVIGGNLLKFLLPQAIPEFKINPEGKVLFIEEIPILIHRFDEYLVTLGMMGILNRVNAVVYGEIPELQQWQVGGSIVESIIDAARVFNPNAPSFMNYPCCHGGDQHGLNTYPMPLGINVDVNADEATVLLKEPLVE